MLRIVFLSYSLQERYTSYISLVKSKSNYHEIHQTSRNLRLLKKIAPNRLITLNLRYGLLLDISIKNKTCKALSNIALNRKIKIVRNSRFIG